MKGIILGDRYELLEIIGEGGMAEVYKAKDNKLNRFVAVKILKKQFADNEDISLKFKREATAIANLSDANIVNVLDVGTQDDINYIVMEYVSGKTLKELIKYTGKLNYNTAIKIALQIAKALDCAHRNNIIHRDIKSQNIMVTESGEVKVTDFGIAKSTDSQTITNTTSIIGSAHYLSPEQAKGTYIDFRSDIYSFGIVLYEMVTGRLPFEGDSPVTVALKHLQEDPVPPKNINSAIPDSLNKLILKAIQKEPIKRYQNAKEIIQDLQKIQDNPDVIIGDNLSNIDNDSTIIMTPVSTPVSTSNTSHISKLEDDYYDDDEYDEEYDDFDEEEKPKKKKNKPGLKKTLITIGIIVAVLLLGSVGFFLAGGGTGSKEVEVPNIVGKLTDDVKQQVEDLGLKLEIKSTQESDKPENTILETDPKAGTKVKKGAVINVIVSAGEKQIEMRDFRNYERADIEKSLKSDGLTNYKITEEYSDTVDVGYWITQTPSAGTKVSKNTDIQIVVSKGPEVKLVDVPNVVGENLSNAKSTLEGAKLKVNDEIKYETTNDKSQDGIVLDQNISGTKVQEGTSIKLTVGKYEEPTIDVSSYGITEGMQLSEAIQILERNKIQYKVIGSGDIVESFTKEIKASGTVEIKAKKANTQAPSENSNGNAGNDNDNGNVGSNN